MTNRLSEITESRSSSVDTGVSHPSVIPLPSDEGHGEGVLRGLGTSGRCEMLGPGDEQGGLRLESRLGPGEELGGVLPGPPPLWLTLGPKEDVEGLLIALMLSTGDEA